MPRWHTDAAGTADHNTTHTMKTQLTALEAQKEFNALYEDMLERPRFATREKEIQLCGLYCEMNALRMAEGLNSLVLPQMERRLEKLGLN